MKIRNLLLGSLCAAIVGTAPMELSGCDNLSNWWNFRSAYDPKPAEVRKDKGHPIDSRISYSGYGHGFTIRMKTPARSVRIDYDVRFGVDAYVTETGDTDVYLSDLILKHNDGVDIVKNLGNGRECYTYREPKCSSSTMWKANKLMLKALEDLKFRQHMWYFNRKSGRNGDVL